MPRKLAILVLAFLLWGCGMGHVRITRLRSFAHIDYGVKVKYEHFGGLKVCYADLGQGPKTLVLIHPALATLRVWNRIWPALVKHFRVIAVDLPGHGKSGKLRSFHYHPRTYARVVRLLLMRLGITKAIFMGNSLGGATSLALAQANPEMVEKLVLIDAAGGRKVSRLKRAFLKLATQPIHLGTVAPHLLRWGAGIFVFDYNNRSTDHFLSYLLSIRSAREYRRWLKVMRRSVMNVGAFGLGDALRQLKVPTLIVWGAKDWVLHPDKGKELHRLIPNSKFRMLEKCGHMPEIECPGPLLKVVLPFLLDR